MIRSDDREYVAIDLETTGLNPRTERVVEVGAVRFDSRGRDLSVYQSLVNPNRPVSPQARAVHGITDEELLASRPAEAVLPEFFDWLQTGNRPILLAHNASFDAAFLGREFVRVGVVTSGLSVVDTLPLARRLRPDSPNHRLDTLARLLSLDLDIPHRALTDAYRVKGLWRALAANGDPGIPLISYPVVDPDDSIPVPTGWDRLAEAITSACLVRMEYAGGSHGMAPRDITPKRFAHHGGVSYVVALCHADQIEKSFRLDRIVRFEAVPATSALIGPGL
jgi:DNA polymerase III epsilon subunit family exonuclease